MKFRVMWTESAEDQLLEAAVYIAYNTGTVENAREFKDKVIEETNKLDLMPDHSIIPRDRMIRKRGYRGLIIGNYIAFTRFIMKPDTWLSALLFHSDQIINDSSYS